MRPLQITLFLVGLIILGTQSLRHVYVRWIEPTSSVLDAYREPVEVDIAASKDLDELVALHEDALVKIEAFEAGSTEKEIHEAEQRGREPYRSRDWTKNAIQRWEAQQEDIFELYFYWSMGLVGIVLGLIAYARINRWLGMVGIITGFSEMAWWTNPLWRAWGPQAQFERLLTAKLVLSLVATALLTVLWLVAERRRRRRDVPTP